MNAQAYESAITSGPVPVILRKDAAGNPVVFLQGELDLSNEGGTIPVWHIGKGTDTETVPLSYYHATTKLEHHEELDLANKFAEEFVPKFGIQIRKRLGKELSKHHTARNGSEQPKSANSTLRRSTDKPSPKEFDQDEYLAKMSVAITAAVTAALKAVNEEYSSTKH